MLPSWRGKLTPCCHQLYNTPYRQMITSGGILKNRVAQRRRPDDPLPRGLSSGSWHLFPECGQLICYLLLCFTKRTFSDTYAQLRTFEKFI